MTLIKRNEENGTDTGRYIRAQVALLFPKNPISPTRSLIFKAHLGSWNCWSLLFFQMFVFFLDTSCMNFDLVRPDRCLKDNADINCQEQNGTLANNLKKEKELSLETDQYFQLVNSPWVNYK